MLPPAGIRVREDRQVEQFPDALRHHGRLVSGGEPRLAVVFEGPVAEPDCELLIVAITRQLADEICI
jgi:hypothetical protein